MRDVRHLGFAKSISKVGSEMLFIGFGVESQVLSPMVIGRWYPEHGMCAQLRFTGPDMAGSVVLTTDLGVLGAIWGEAVGDDAPISVEEAYDLLGEMGNQLLGGIKTYLTEFRPELRITISTPEWLTDARLGVASEATPAVPVLVSRMRHSAGDIHVGITFDVLGEAFQEDTPLSWCFPEGEARARGAA